MKLDLLESHTEFSWQGQTYRKGINYVSKFFEGQETPLVRCEPFLGGKFQTNKDLGVWIPRDAEVIIWQ